MYFKSSKLLLILWYTAELVFFQKWPKPAQLNILSPGVTTISIEPTDPFRCDDFPFYLRNAVLILGCVSFRVKYIHQSVWPDLAIFCTLDNHSKPEATIILPKLPTLLGNFCKGVKIIHFYIEIIFGQLLKTFGNFYLVTLLASMSIRLPHFQNEIALWEVRSFHFHLLLSRLPVRRRTSKREIDSKSFHIKKAKKDYCSILAIHWDSEKQFNLKFECWTV